MFHRTLNYVDIRDPFRVIPHVTGIADVASTLPPSLMEPKNQISFLYAPNITQKLTSLVIYAIHSKSTASLSLPNTRLIACLVIVVVMSSDGCYNASNVAGSSH
jgi:hypothetical protein